MGAGGGAPEKTAWELIRLGALVILAHARIIGFHETKYISCGVVRRIGFIYNRVNSHKPSVKIICMTKMLVLFGSGEFTDAMLDVDRYILSLSPRKNKVAILPTAAGQEKDYKKWIDMGVEHFKKLGVDVFGLDIANHDQANDQKLVNKLDRTTLIYISGGDPGYLFHTLNNSLLWDTMREKFQEGTILVGSSAGAMIMGNYIISNVYKIMENGDEPLWEKAFGLAECPILPHYDYVVEHEKDLLRNILEKASAEIKKKIWAIDENTAVIIRDGEKIEIKGAGGLHSLENGIEVNLTVSGKE